MTIVRNEEKRERDKRDGRQIISWKKKAGRDAGRQINRGEEEGLWIRTTEKV